MVKEVRNHWFCSTKIELKLFDIFCSKMIEQIKSRIVRGETYYVKRKNGEIMGNLIFDSYTQLKTALWFYVPNKPYAYLFQLNEIIIYRYVTNEEYLKKVKEKYDSKCLDIVLKQLVNEHFSW